MSAVHWSSFVPEAGMRDKGLMKSAVLSGYPAVSSPVLLACCRYLFRRVPDRPLADPEKDELTEL